MTDNQKRIGVLTSGGDAPGMNAALRAVVRLAGTRGYDVLGFRHGYTGLIEGTCTRMDARSVGGIIDRGGTILGTSRCEGLKSSTGLQAAAHQFAVHGLDALVIIGGNGSHEGAHKLMQHGVRVIGIASTINNDLPGCDLTIGATTALDTAIDAIDRIRVTASAHRRVFLVEVMGGDSGHLALSAGIAGGAESIVVPEIDVNAESIAAQIVAAYKRGKSHAIVVVAQGARHDADGIANHFHSNHDSLGFEIRVTKLGHIQRGGAPRVYDRLIATQLGAATVDLITSGQFGVTLGMVAGKVTPIPISEVIGARKPLDRQLYELAQLLAV